MRIQIKYGKEDKVSYEIFSFESSSKADDVFREFAYMCNNLVECPMCVLSKKTVKCPHWNISVLAAMSLIRIGNVFLW